MRRMFYRLSNEFKTVKMEFVTDHLLTIAAFDQGKASDASSCGVFLINSALQIQSSTVRACLCLSRLIR